MISVPVDQDEAGHDTGGHEFAPAVIDLLNVEPSFVHHWRAYGAWSCAPSQGEWGSEETAKEEPASSADWA